MNVVIHDAGPTSIFDRATDPQAKIHDASEHEHWTTEEPS